MEFLETFLLSQKSHLNPHDMQTNNQLAEVTINYHPALKASEMPRINCSQDTVVLLRELWSEKMNYIEESYLLLLNRANRLLGYTLLSSGGTSGTVVDQKIIFQTALKTNAHAIILAHNHPSGNTTPSDADIHMTKTIKEAGKFLCIQLLDHIILTEEGFYSFADEGML
jgi:DNA repair protein RadC